MKQDSRLKKCHLLALSDRILEVDKEKMMNDPVAFFVTWTTYGTWLPGNERGWVRWGEGSQMANPELETIALGSMKETAVVLDVNGRIIAEDTIRKHCEIRGWTLHAVAVRSNHVHVLVTANGVKPEKIVAQFKAWCTRKLKEITPSRLRWWTEGSSRRWVFDEKEMATIVEYVNEAQDRPR